MENWTLIIFRNGASLQVALSSEEVIQQIAKAGRDGRSISFVGMTTRQGAHFLLNVPDIVAVSPDENAGKTPPQREPRVVVNG